MKKILLLVLVVLALLVSGCTSYDADKIVTESIEKMEAMDSYRVSYTMSISTYGISMGGEMDLYKKGEMARVDTLMSLLGEQGVSSTYQLPSGTYTCTASLGPVRCVKGMDTEGMITPEDSININTELIEKGVISLRFNSIADIIGRSCYNITSDFDLSKMGELGPGDLEGLDIVENMASALEAFSEFQIIQCYDFETGMPLEMSLVFEVDMSKIPQGGVVMPGTMTMSMDMRATSFEPNAVIEDSIFALPVEPTGASELCTDAETGTVMTRDEAMDIAYNSDCMEEGTLVPGTELCNAYTGTWWFDLDLEREGCAPACVVSVFDRTAEINWRCTGLITE